MAIGPSVIRCGLLAPTLRGFLEDSCSFDDLDEETEQCCIQSGVRSTGGKALAVEVPSDEKFNGLVGNPWSIQAFEVLF